MSLLERKNRELKLTVLEKIKAARKFKKLTQVEVSNLTGISQGYLSKLEKGHLLPSIPAMLALEAVLWVRLL